MMLLARYVKTPIEEKRYTIEYTDWLDTGETVAGVVFSVAPVTATPLEVATSLIDAAGQVVAYWVRGGDDGAEYQITVVATTSGGQIKEDAVFFTVRDI